MKAKLLGSLAFVIVFFLIVIIMVLLNIKVGYISIAINLAASTGSYKMVVDFFNNRDRQRK